ncbi:hypothetical protein FHR84_003555 [Actinopolyspora biskrensis]|uniref:Uncharacterized protein n=1 Tax=Actinopolyspora biskrensis TaxID=1470178 RepID=A0A852Z9I4_9ACTN|nr:hypothetical protein [Actinopolyspora biskrensis]
MSGGAPGARLDVSRETSNRVSTSKRRFGYSSTNGRVFLSARKVRRGLRFPGRAPPRDVGHTRRCGLPAAVLSAGELVLPEFPAGWSVVPAQPSADAAAADGRVAEAGWFRPPDLLTTYGVRQVARRSAESRTAGPEGNASAGPARRTNTHVVAS